jgi:hypothetical protein
LPWRVVRDIAKVAVRDLGVSWMVAMEMVTIDHADRGAPSRKFVAVTRTATVSSSRRLAPLRAASREEESVANRRVPHVAVCEVRQIVRENLRLEHVARVMIHPRVNEVSESMAVPRAANIPKDPMTNSFKKHYIVKSLYEQYHHNHHHQIIMDTL